MAVRKAVDVLKSQLNLPWPHALLALWTAILLIGGPRPAKFGLNGPIYPTEVLFLIGLSALFFGATRKRLASIRSCQPPVWLVAAFGLFALSFLLALVRGAQIYGSHIIEDVGLGYILLVPFITLAFIGRERWQDSALKIFFWASIVTVPFIVLSHFSITNFAPLSLSDGFVLLFSVAPLLDRWLNGSLVWFGKVYVVALSILTVAFVPSRSAILSFLLGLMAVVALNLRTVRRRVIAAVLVLTLASAGLAVYFVKPGLVKESNPVRLARETVAFSPNAKGNNARWRFDFARTLLRRSVRSNSSALIGVGLGKPSRFIWNSGCCLNVYDYRDSKTIAVDLDRASRLIWRKSCCRNAYGDRDGKKNSPTLTTSGLPVTGPHNGFVDFIYRLGWPAAIAITAILIFLVLAVLEVFRDASRSDRHALNVLLALVLCGVVVALTSDSFRVPETAVPFAFTVGILLARVLPLWRENLAHKQSNKPGQLWRYKAVWLAPLLALAIALVLILPYIGQASQSKRTVLTAKQTRQLAASFRKSFVSRISSLNTRALFGGARCHAGAQHKYYLCSLTVDDTNPVTGADSSVRFEYKVKIKKSGCWTASGRLLSLSQLPQKLHPLRKCSVIYTSTL